MEQPLSAHELAEILGTGREPFLLDVREPDEVVDGAIPGAVNIPLGEVPNHLDDLPRERPIVTICARGQLSRLAAGLLAAAGFDAHDLTGGMAAWAQVHGRPST